MFTLSFETDNAAFDNPEPEVARILRALAERIERGAGFDGPQTVQDVNGNTVGAYRLSAGRPRKA